MKVVVAGSRDYCDYEEAKEFIDSILYAVNEDIIILSGGARGADSLGERYATEHGYKIERHKADWEKFGRAAGPIRNKEMAQECDIVICFWDGRSKGTRSMIELAKEHERKVNIKYINNTAKQ